jgi:hypothetical protein
LSAWGAKRFKIKRELVTIIFAYTRGHNSLTVELNFYKGDRLLTVNIHWNKQFQGNKKGTAAFIEFK